ncbi:MAG: alpha/beta hydrolase [Propylenella sp.]
MEYPDQKALDANFTLDSISDLDALFARRARAAKAALAEYEVVRGIAYGSDPSETLILFPARSAKGPPPVQVFIHGGFWSSLAAADFAFVAAGFVPHGAAVAVIDYPLIPKVRLGDIVRSCMRAVGYLYSNGSDHSIDPERIFLSGNSAGAHLIIELMDRPRLNDAGLPADAVKGGTAISGLYDLRSIMASFRNEQLGFTAEEVAEFSPLLRKTEIASPVIATVGATEMPEFVDQTERLVQHCRENGTPVEHLLPEADHITIVLDHFAVPGTALNRAALRQMGLA